MTNVKSARGFLLALLLVLCVFASGAGIAVAVMSMEEPSVDVYTGQDPVSEQVAMNERYQAREAAEQRAQERAERRAEARAERLAAERAERRAEARAKRRAVARAVARAEARAQRLAAERRAEARAERLAAKRAERRAAHTHEIHGTITVPHLNGALVTRVGGYPGQPLEEFGMRDLKRLGGMLRALRHGQTYPCPQGSGGGYSDLAVGTQVVVEDGAGMVLGTSSLTGGVLGMHGCTFSFTVQVPETDFYGVTISHRGTLTYSLSQLEAAGWQVAAKL